MPSTLFNKNPTPKRSWGKTRQIGKKVEIKKEVKKVVPAKKVVAKKAHTAYVRIVDAFSIRTYFGGTIDVHDTEHQEDSIIIHYNTDQEYNDAIEAGKENLKKVIEDLFTYRAQVILEHKFTVHKLSKGQLYERAKNPTVIKMKAVVPTSYQFITGVSMNIPKWANHTVPEFLHSFYKKYIPTLTLGKVKEILGLQNDVLRDLTKNEFDYVEAAEDFKVWMSL